MKIRPIGVNYHEPFLSSNTKSLNIFYHQLDTCTTQTKHVLLYFQFARFYHFPSVSNIIILYFGKYNKNTLLVVKIKGLYMFSFRNLAVEMGHLTFLSSHFGIILFGSALNKLIAYIYI